MVVFSLLSIALDGAVRGLTSTPPVPTTNDPFWDAYTGGAALAAIFSRRSCPHPRHFCPFPDPFPSWYPAHFVLSSLVGESTCTAPAAEFPNSTSLCPIWRCIEMRTEYVVRSRSHGDRIAWYGLVDSAAVDLLFDARRFVTRCRFLGRPRDPGFCLQR